MLNEKFAKLAAEKEIVVEGQDPMPTVQATVIPGSGSDPSQVSDAQTANSNSAGDQGTQPTVSPSAAPSGQSITDLGGSTTTPNEHDEDGEENPGAKAAAPVGDKAAQSDGSAQTSNINDAGDQGTQPTVGAEVAYGTGVGGAVTYPIHAGFELDVSDDIKALLEGTELSEEFAEKAKTIFEAAVKAKLQEEYDKLVKHFAEETEKKVEEIKNELSEDVNGTVNYAVRQWLEENQLAVDRGIKTEITEDFIAGLKNLFEEHYISIPDEKVDVVEGMADQIRKMEERLDEQVKANVKLQTRLDENTKKVILNTVSEGLVDTQKDKLAALAEGIEFTSEEEYSKKINTLKESYFKGDAPKVASAADETPVEEVANTPAMNAYVDALSRWDS